MQYEGPAWVQPKQFASSSCAKVPHVPLMARRQPDQRTHAKPVFVSQQRTWEVAEDRSELACLRGHTWEADSGDSALAPAEQQKRADPCPGAASTRNTVQYAL